MLFASTANASNFMPPQGTEIAAGVDSLYKFLLIVSFISCVLVIGGLIYFAMKYRRRGDNDKTPYISHNTMLEFLWSFIPFVIFMVVFVWGWIIFAQLRNYPENSLEIAVQAQKWNWNFTYKNGKQSAAEFYVPVNEPVKLIMTSSDVLHSFFVPAFRNKQDVVPGRYMPYWFKASKIGKFQVFCAEYCGDDHSGMKAIVHVVTRAEFETWLSATDPYKDVPPIEIGKKVYTTRCASCHSLTEQKLLGPGWLGVWGREQTMADGSKVLVDENYVRESIMNPNAKIVAGYPAAMTPFAGQLSEKEVMGVIEFMKSLK